MKNKYTNEKIVERIKNVHGDKYDLSEVVYTGIFNKIKVICPIHGVFETTPNNFINQHKGCPKCGHIEKWNKRGRITTKDFIKKAREVHGDKYDYSKINYIGTHTKICIICPEHGEFWQTPANHLTGNGCPRCANNLKYSTEEFITKAKEKHGNKYDYSNVKYVNAHENICVICPKHGEFLITPNNHLKGEGCPVCKSSSLENETRKVLSDRRVNFIRQQKFDWLINEETNYKLSLDFYLPDYNAAIECQGRQHFEPIDFFGGSVKFNYNKELDNKKRILCENNNVKLFYINYNDNVVNKISEIINKL